MKSLSNEPAIPDWPTGERLRYLAIDGYPFSYVEAGTTLPALLLVHGSLSDARSFQAQVMPLSVHARTVAVTLRHGYPERWDGRGDNFSVEQHADDLAHFVAALDLGRVHVLGHSRGGAVALALALRHPATVRTLLLADPGGLDALLPDTAEGRAMAAQSAAMFSRLRERLAAGDSVAVAHRFVEDLNGPGAWERRTEAQRQMMLDNIATGPACAERPQFKPDEIRSLAMPVLAITGSASPPRYRAMFDALRALNDRVSPTVVIEGGDHGMHRGRADAFNAAIAAFLDAHR